MSTRRVCCSFHRALQCCASLPALYLGLPCDLAPCRRVHPRGGRPGGHFVVSQLSPAASKRDAESHSWFEIPGQRVRWLRLRIKSKTSHLLDCVPPSFPSPLPQSTPAPLRSRTAAWRCWRACCTRPHQRARQSALPASGACVGICAWVCMWVVWGWWAWQPVSIE